MTRIVCGHPVPSERTVRLVAWLILAVFMAALWGITAYGIYVIVANV